MPYELLIWDNASNEEGMQEYLAILEKQENFKVFYSRYNMGVWQASNRLIAKAQSRDTLGFIKLDNDCKICTKGWTEKWIQCCEVNPEVGMVGANIEGRKRRSPGVRNVTLNKHELLLFVGREGTGGAVFVPNRTFKQLGFYNEEYGLYGHADKDYSRRVALSGQYFAYHCGVEMQRFAVNNDDLVGGYREHKNVYVRRNRKLYILNRYLYEKRYRSLGVWYEKFNHIIPKEVKRNPGFVWSSLEPRVHWETGKLSRQTKSLVKKHKLEEVRK